MPRILISYRREDTAAYAGRLYDGLSEHYGDKQVFMDISTLQPGVDFVAEIERAVAQCDIVLVVIGKRWLEVVDPQGRRRLEQPEDFVRLEVAAGLNRDVRVVPVLVGGATMPTSQELPDTLRSLARRNAIDISDERWHYDLSRLLSALDSALTPTTVATSEVQLPTKADPVPARSAAAWAPGAMVFAAWFVGVGLAESLFFIPRLPLRSVGLWDVSVGWLLCGLVAGAAMVLATAARPRPWTMIVVAGAVALAVGAADAILYPIRVVRTTPNLVVALTSGGSLSAALCGAVGGLAGLATAGVSPRQRASLAIVAALGAGVGFTLQWQMGWRPVIWTGAVAAIAVWQLLARMTRNDQLVPTVTPSVG